MPETPKSFEEAVECVKAYGRGSASMLQRKLRIGYGPAIDLLRRMQREGLLDDNFLPVAPQPPQAAAVPARQDDPVIGAAEKCICGHYWLSHTAQGCDYKDCHCFRTVPARQDAVPEKRVAQPIPCPECAAPIFVRPNKTIVAHYDGPGYRCTASETVITCECHLHKHQVCDICQGIATLPPQTAAGEGELPELDVTDADMAAARQVYGGRPTSLVVTREMQDLVLQRTIAEIICRERQLRQAIAQRDEARKRFGVGPHVLTARTGEQALCGGPDVCPACIHEAKLAALDVPKPESEEIERLIVGVLRERTGLLNYRAEQIAKEVLSRLRSLPSEPGFGVQRRKK